MQFIAGVFSPRFLWPLAGIACFGLVVFLITVMIVLALIPTFTAKRDLQPGPNSQRGKSVRGIRVNFIILFRSFLPHAIVADYEQRPDRVWSSK